MLRNKDGQKSGDDFSCHICHCHYRLMGLLKDWQKDAISIII